MTDLDARLARGPLRVRSLWSESSPERLVRWVLWRRRFYFALDAVAVLALVLGLSGLRFLLKVTNATAPVAVSTTAFSDGLVAELSSRETVLRIEEDTATRVVAKLTGGARFKVVPNHERTFEVRAGDVRVRVLGTTFSVQQLPSAQTQVLVEHGRVEVAWLGGFALLLSGQGGTFPPTAGSEEPELADAPAPPAANEPTWSPLAPHNPPRPASGGGWREHARAGDYGAAYDELTAKGRDAVRDEAEDLMLAADVARLSAHPEDAVLPLRRVYERHASDRRAPVAAFTLGRVLLDDSGRPAEAAAAFHKARVLWPGGPLAEDGMAREAGAWERAGRAEQARVTAGEYLGRYPEG